MARFRNQVSKGIDTEPETKNQNMETGLSEPETKNQKQEDVERSPDARKSAVEVSATYSESDMEAVNVAGFKVPYVVREHWKKGCREKRVKLSPMLKRILADEFGLPPGITVDDL